MVTAEQVTAALTGGVVTTAVNIAAVRPEVMEQLAPFVPLCEKLGRLAQALGEGAPDRVEVEFRGRLADQDTRILGIAALVGILSGHTEEPVNLVNGPHMAEERGIELIETRDATSEDFTELVVVRLHTGEDVVEVAGTGVGPRNIPYLARVWGEDFYLPFAEHLAIFRYTDQPGMIGRVGTIFGEEGVNIVSAAVGAEPGGRHGGDGAHDGRARQPGDDRPDPGARGLLGRPRRLAVGTGLTHEGGRAHRPRRAGGPAGPGAAGPARRTGRGADRR